MKKRCMISQPMAGKTKEEIIATREPAKQHIEKLGYEFVNNLFDDDSYPQSTLNKPLWCLAVGLEILSTCDAVCFCDGWEKARGCKAEHDIAVAYGVEILYTT